ncbi:MAG: hypothetical protein COU27_00310 [Candidatus Levybacteria bacterium CG10_big_fil_rev_8_21_14_0_10_36_7]|nr:MAG: hypothetical protein COU27_00310 [Candidatus Levybacteria bacterium CG10_big_fil_rev_8_21_14_0_10_36_7]
MIFTDNSFFIFFVAIFLLIIIGSFAWGGILAAPWVPLRKKDVKRMLTLASLQKGEKLVDLGCGDGRIILTATNTYGTVSTGYEIALLPFILCYFKILALGFRKKTKVRMKNFFHQDLSGYDVVTLFLTPKAMAKLGEKLKKELKPGSRVLSYAFHIPGWEPDEKDKPSTDGVTIYKYKIK